MNPDTLIRKFEKRLTSSPNDMDTASHLTMLLDSQMPSKNGLGTFADCQRMIARKYRKAIAQQDLLNPAKAVLIHKEWQALLQSQNVQFQFPVPQLVMGNIPQIKGTEPLCGQYLALFKKEEVFPRICTDCFKVQIIAPDLATFMQVYFILRALKLPRDNARKCMIEFREGIPNPYKGYIFCESEDEAKICLETFQQDQKTAGIYKVKCRITHGCSEFGIKYPEFKYSDDRSHRSFERPASWDQSVSDFLSSVEVPTNARTNYSKAFISIRDIIGFRTWINYAEIIGDNSCEIFLDKPSAIIPEPFATRIRNQAQIRRTQLEGLQEIFSA